MILKVKVKPGSTQNQIGLSAEGEIQIKVRAVPEKGKANQAVIELLAEKLGISRSGLTVVRGESSRDKWLEIRDFSPEEVKKKLFP